MKICVEGIGQSKHYDVFYDDENLEDVRVLDKTANNAYDSAAVLFNVEKKGDSLVYHNVLHHGISLVGDFDGFLRDIFEDEMIGILNSREENKGVFFVSDFDVIYYKDHLGEIEVREIYNISLL